MWKINNPITEKYLYHFFSQTYIDQQCEEAIKEKSQYVHFDNGSNICNIQFHVLLKEFEKIIFSVYRLTKKEIQYIQDTVN